MKLSKQPLKRTNSMDVTSMTSKALFWAVWAGFIGYAFFLAPPDQPDTASLIIKLSTGDWQNINPLVIALFNLMGIWPMIYGCLLLIDGRVQPFPAWPFVVGSFGLGAFVLLPYLALRQPNPNFVGEKTLLLKLVDNRWTGVAIATGTVILLAYGLLLGDWSNFVEQWQTSRFIHVMSLDFCLLCLLFPILLGDDLARRNLQDRRLFWAIALTPLLGPALYLALRPPISQASELAGTPAIQS